MLLPPTICIPALEGKNFPRDELNTASAPAAAPGEVSPHVLLLRMEEREEANKLQVGHRAPRNAGDTWLKEEAAHRP